MRHWFDDLARAAANDERGISRRGLLAGTAVGVAAASPLGSQAMANAAMHIEGIAAGAGCVPCLTLVIKSHNKRAKNCLDHGTPDASVRPRRKRKATAVSGVKKLACVAGSRAELGGDVNSCRRNACGGTSAPPIVGAVPGASSCPPTTYQCPDGSCCYGGDLCCVCPNVGTQCCVASVGCACC